MSFFNKQTLLSELIDRTEVITSNTRSFLRLDQQLLYYKPESQCWSITEIYGHLNITNKTCIHSILKRIKTSPDVSTTDFMSGWLGDWVYEKLMPRADGSVYKISAPKKFHAPNKELDAIEVLNQFLEDQDIIHDILLHSSTKDLKQIRVPFYFTRAVNFRLGDTLRFLIAHNERHLLQAHRVVENSQMVQKG